MAEETFKNMPMAKLIRKASQTAPLNSGTHWISTYKDLPRIPRSGYKYFPRHRLYEALKRSWLRGQDTSVALSA
jgi:hypothetical protein